MSIRRSIASHGRLVLIASALSLAAPAFAQAPERLADKDVKALLEEVDTGRDKFEGNLDGQFKSSTITNANGETKVSVALQDYQDATQKLKDRFTPDYAAGAEAATVLKQSTAINAFMLRQASSMKGRPEWDQQTVNLKKLAAAYGAAFPLADGAAAAGPTTKRWRPRRRDRCRRGSLQGRSRQGHGRGQARQGCREEGRRNGRQAGQRREIAHQRRQAGRQRREAARGPSGRTQRFSWTSTRSRPRRTGRLCRPRSSSFSKPLACPSRNADHHDETLEGRTDRAG